MFRGLASACTAVHRANNDVCMCHFRFPITLWCNLIWIRCTIHVFCLVLVKLFNKTTWKCMTQATNTSTQAQHSIQVSHYFQQFGSQFKNSKANMTSTLWSMSNWWVALGDKSSMNTQVQMNLARLHLVLDSVLYFLTQFHVSASENKSLKTRPKVFKFYKELSSQMHLISLIALSFCTNCIFC